MTVKTDFREFSRLDRYRVFEILLWWEGRCNATDLSLLFNVRRENVTKDIQAYRADHPDQVIFDSLFKAYTPTASFAPIYTSGKVAEYVDFIRRFRGSESDMAIPWLETGPRPYIEPDPQLFRAVREAIRTQTPIQVRYRSWNHPDGKDRTIHPHALAYSGLRWHCRAFDEATESYRDFHLGRFESYELASGASFVSGEHDADWHEHVTLELVLNPALSASEKRLVQADFGLSEGSIRLKCRRAMALYVLQSYQIDPSFSEDAKVAPRMHPLVLGNPELFPEPLLS